MRPLKRSYPRGTAIILIVILAVAASVPLFLSFGRVALVLTPEESAWLRAHPEPALGVSFHYPPYETFKPGQPYSGLTADYVRLIENATGLRFRPVRGVNADDAARKLKEGQADALAAVQPNSALAGSALLTDSYISVPAVIITRKEQSGDLTLEDLSGLTVGLAVSEEFNDYLRRRRPDPPFNVAIPEGGYIGGLRALSVGDYDALICDMAVAGHYIATAGISNLRVAGVTGYEVRHAFAVRPDQPLLASILDKALQAIPDEERQAVEDRWIGLQVKPFWQSSDFRRWFLSAAGLVSGLLLLGLIWIYSLRAQVASRTALLSSVNRVLLGTLGLRGESEVLEKCLEEAARLTGSRGAAFGGLEGGALRLEFRRGGLGPDEEPRAEKVELSPDEAGRLRAGEAALRPGGDLLLPVRLDDEAIGAAILLHRPGKAFQKRELAGLMEWIFIVHEVVRRKRAERALNEKEVQLQQSQRLEAVGVFAGGIAHDFNNILGAIIANGEMLELFHSPDEEVEKKIQAMLGAAYKGREVVRRILDFTRRNDEKKSKVRLGRLVRDTLAILEPSIPKNVELRFPQSGDDPEFYGNSTQIHQLIMNLSVNAVQVMGKGGVLSFEAGRADKLPPEACGYGVSPGVDGAVICSRGRNLDAAARGYAVLSVKDSGPGLDEAVMRQMFSPLFSTKAPGEGTGLGLAIVDSIAGMHKAYILVRSVPGEGAEFRVYFPILPSEA